MPNDPRHNRALHMLDAIEKRIEEARQRPTYDDVRVDMLAIIQYINRNLSLIERQYPPEPPSDTN